MEDKKLYSVYGARKSKKGNGFNISLISGEGEEKYFVNAFVKNENAIDKGDGYVYIRVKALAPKEEAITADDLPF